MAVALHDLIGDGVRREPQLGANVLFHFRPLMCERAHRTGELADGDLPPNVRQPLPVPAGFFVPNGQLEAERNRFTMNAVRPANHHRMLVLQRLPFQDGNQFFKIVEDEIKRLGHLHGQGGVHDIRRGQPHVEKPMLRPD